MLNNEFLGEFLNEFVLETQERLARLDTDLIALEKTPSDKSAIAPVFRALHNIKGTAGFMGLTKLEGVAHSAESLLSRLRAGDFRFNPPIANAMLRVVDALREMLANIKDSGGEGPGDYTSLITEVDRLRESGGASATPQDESAYIGEPAAVSAYGRADAGPSSPSARSDAELDSIEASDFRSSGPPTAPPPHDPGEQGLSDSDASFFWNPAALSAGGWQPDPVADAGSDPFNVAGNQADVETRMYGSDPSHAAPPPSPPPAAKIAPIPPAPAPAPPVPPAPKPIVAEAKSTASPAAPAAAKASTATKPPESKPAETTAVTATDAVEPRRANAADASIRVDVGLLDKLMTLVGELVLARNQILQFGSDSDDGGYQGAVQRLNLLTTELQASVMKTRMQPIGNVLSKFPRVARDLAVACGKKVRFEMEGQETELDKTLLEAIRDPLTHMVRNAIDHGIEPPEARKLAGKSEEGRLRMLAFHEGGKVVIEVADDGGGIDPNRVREKALAANLVSPEVLARMSRQDVLRLIFLPGFSTADKVTQFSGRGVGMDVVRTNIEKIGGTVEVESSLGHGTTIRTKIPLTLAIIPALIVGSAGERYAIPQVSLLEVVRLDPAQLTRGVEHIYGAPVYRLRGALLPLVFLDKQLGLTDADEPTGDLNIVVLQADDRSFGVVVDSIRDTEEMVVKPLQKQLKGIEVFAGAAIMGDGRVALVLDVLGLAQRSGVVSGPKALSLGEHQQDGANAADEAEPLLLFTTNDGSQMAMPLSSVARLEEFSKSSLETLGARLVVQYRGEILPLIDVSQQLDAVGGNGRARHADPRLPARRRDGDDEPLAVIVYAEGARQVGLIVKQILDIVYEHVETGARDGRPGVLFNAVVRGRVTEFLDVAALIREATPHLLAVR